MAEMLPDDFAAI